MIDITFTCPFVLNGMPRESYADYQIIETFGKDVRIYIYDTVSERIAGFNQMNVCFKNKGDFYYQDYVTPLLELDK